MSYGSSRRDMPCILLVVLFIICIPFHVNAQQPATSALDKRVTIHSKVKLTLSEIIFLIDDEGKVVITIPGNDSDPDETYTVNFTNKTIREIFQTLLGGRGYTWKSGNGSDITLTKTNTVTLNKEIPKKVKPDTFTITGIVTGEDSLRLTGATIHIKGTSLGGTADVNGRFSIHGIQGDAIIQVSMIGYALSERMVSRNNDFVLRLNTNSLNEAEVIGYGTTKKALSTASVNTVLTSKTYPSPYTNLLISLAGQIPGLFVTETNGNPGAEIKIRLRGISSIDQGSDPLCLIDGVPYPSSSVGTGNVYMSNGGQNPFWSLNSSNIESITVLKDADATSIYGSRGANGVILITTKKGKSGRTKCEISLGSGWAGIARKMDLLNTEEYIAMRKEAFANDGITPTESNAADLLLWDTKRYTNWLKSLIGGTAKSTNANVAFSGGNSENQYYFSANYNRQTTVYPTDLGDNRASLFMNFTHTSSDRKFRISITGNYNTDKNTLPADLTPYINMAPNTPALKDAAGNLLWSYNGGTFINALALLLAKSSATTDNFISSINMQYELFKGVTLKASGGYNDLHVNEKFTNPEAAQNPNGNNVISTGTFGNTTTNIWIIEPQVEFVKSRGKFNLTTLVGTTIEKDTKTSATIFANDFINDDLIESAAAARNTKAATGYTEYRYQALFSRININWADKYLLSITGRRDGSSRFGANEQIGNFGAIGAGWIFTKEPFFEKIIPFLSYGKLRGSYGVTGNDQIGDYLFLDNYQVTDGSLQGQNGYTPSRLANANYHWEKNTKYETSIELGAFKDRVLMTVNYFKNESSNQLIAYSLPDQTGFSSYFRNFGATVQNTGWEFEVSGVIANRKNFQWTAGGNLTVASNKLTSFPGLESSSYANRLVLNQPLDIQKLLHYTGVNPTTGLYQFAGTNIPADQTSVRNLTPQYYGGLTSTVSFKNFEFSFLWQFTKQNGINDITAFGGNAPGTRYNQPRYVLNRWRKEGDQAPVQRYTTTGEAFNTNNNYALFSDARISDASFIRLKNTVIYYTLPKSFLKKVKFDNIRFYMQANNLLTITKYKGLDPESGTNNLPVLRGITLGAIFKF